MSATPSHQLTQRFQQNARQTGLSQKAMQPRRAVFHKNQLSRTTHLFSKTPNIFDSRNRISLKPAELLFDKFDNEHRVKRRDGSKGKRYKVEKSPYLSEAAPIERMLKLLVPVHGPNESVKLSIKKHNQMNLKNAELFIIKKTATFHERMSAYAVRMGLSADSKVFVMNSKDVHIREELLRRGWAEGSDKETSLFHLKWVYKDSPADYSTLQEGQQYNHFKNNEQLTNKYYLQRNIKSFPQQDRPKIPLSYDIDSHQDNVAFQNAYLQIQSHRFFQQISLRLGQLFTSYQKKIQQMPQLFIKNSHSLRPRSPKRASQPNWDLLYNLPLAELHKNKNLWQMLTSLHKVVCFVVGYVSKKLKMHYCCFRMRPSTSEVWECLRQLSKQLQFTQHQMYSVLSPFYVMEILKLNIRCRQIWGDQNSKNIWILKPSGVSRGSGIVITGDMNKIHSLRHGKVVQKYIERPLLLKCGRKFDIRQWVLVKSFFPLQAYIYRHCYARLSSVKYSNTEHDNHQKHLTNYTANKDSFLKLRQQYHLSGIAATSMSTALPQEELVSQLGAKWYQLKQQIKKDIIKTLLCCREQIVKKEECFEVYGFDILIDDTFQPHILEVNLSPACQNREFLGGYLQQMAQGLVNMFEGAEPNNWQRLSTLQFGCLNRPSFNRISNSLTKILMIQRWWRQCLKKRSVGTQ